MTVTLRERRLPGDDRERHVEDVDAVHLALDDDGRRLGDRRDERIDVRARVVSWRRLLGFEIDDEDRFRRGPPT